MNSKKLLATLCSLSMMIGTSSTQSKVSARSAARTVGAVSCGVVSGVSGALSVASFVASACFAVEKRKDKGCAFLEFIDVVGTEGCLRLGLITAGVSLISGLASYLFARSPGNSDENAKISEKTENSK